jgi:hypothetical protein
MTLSHALIISVAIMIAAPAYAQNYDNQRTQEREVTTKVQPKYVAPRARHVVTRRSRNSSQDSRYSSQEERGITADLNRRGAEVQDSNGYNRDNRDNRDNQR